MAETGILAALRVAARAITKAQRASRRDFVLWPPHSPAAAPTGMSAATEVSGGAGEAQEG